MTNDERLESYWQSIPVGRENAWGYKTICAVWRMSERRVRAVLHELSCYDNGDDFILIRSSNKAGFYRTDHPGEIAAYRSETLSRGRKTFAPLRKIDRVLKPCDGQLNMTNNLKTVRTSLGLSASWVCSQMQLVSPGFDGPTLSKMECGKCWPTPAQLAKLAAIYGCKPCDLLDADLYHMAF